MINKVEPTGLLVVILPHEDEKKFGDIFLTDSSQEKNQKADIISVGPDVPEVLKVGMTVLTNKFAGTEITVDKVVYKLYPSDEILAIVGED